MKIALIISGIILGIYGYLTISVVSTVPWVHSKNLLSGYDFIVGLIEYRDGLNKGTFFDYFPFAFLVACALPFGGLGFWFFKYCEEQEKRNSPHGNARWAKPEEITQQGLNYQQGIVLGKYGKSKLYMDDPLSVLVLAPPGTGKTSGIVIPTLFELQNSVIVFDKKKELLEITRSKREEFSNTLIFDPYDPNSAVFNPFCKTCLPEKPEEISAYCRDVSYTLIQPDQNEKKYFADATRNVINFFAQYLIFKNGETSLPEVWKHVFNQERMVLEMTRAAKDPDIPDALRRYGNSVHSHTTAKDQWAGVAGLIQNTLEIFNEELPAKAATGTNQLSGALLRNEKTTLYVTIKHESKLKSARALFTMLFETLANDVISENPTDDQESVTFILDEFVRLKRLDVLVDLPAIGRSYRVNSLFIAQDYGQIEELYGKSGISKFESTAAYKVIFCQNNLDTAKRISDLIGTYAKERMTKSMGDRNSVNITTEAVPLVSAQDILSLRENKCIIISQRYANRPIDANIAYYFKDKQYKNT